MATSNEATIEQWAISKVGIKNEIMYPLGNVIINIIFYIKTDLGIRQFTEFS